MGAAYFLTPRETVKDFVGLLNVLEQNREADWRALLGDIKTSAADVTDPYAEMPSEDDGPDEGVPDGFLDQTPRRSPSKPPGS